MRRACRIWCGGGVPAAGARLRGRGRDGPVGGNVPVERPELDDAAAPGPHRLRHRQVERFAARARARDEPARDGHHIAVREKARVLHLQPVECPAHPLRPIFVARAPVELAAPWQVGRLMQHHLRIERRGHVGEARARVPAGGKDVELAFPGDPLRDRTRQALRYGAHRALFSGWTLKLPCNSHQCRPTLAPCARRSLLFTRFKLL